MEQELLGVGSQQTSSTAIASKAIYPITPIRNLSENSYAIILVEVQKIKVIHTKKVKIWLSYRWMTVRKNWMLPSFQIYIDRLLREVREGAFYYIKGKVQSRDGRLQMIAHEIREAVAERFWIQGEKS